MEIRNLSFCAQAPKKVEKAPEKPTEVSSRGCTDVINQAGNEALRNAALAGINLNRSMNILQGGRDYKIEGKYKVIGEMPTKEANAEWASRGYDSAPYKDNGTAQIIELTKDTRFVRTYDGVNSGMAGSWLMRYEDIEGLTPEQIADKFALPQVPKYMCDCVLEKGTKIRMGECNPLFGYNGGGTQFDLMGQRVGKFENERLIEA